MLGTNRCMFISLQEEGMCIRIHMAQPPLRELVGFCIGFLGGEGKRDHVENFA